MNMNSVDLRRCKRIVQYLWDPEPRNDEDPDASIWCLGKEYTPSVTQSTPREGHSKPGNYGVLPTESNSSLEPLVFDENHSRTVSDIPESSDSHGWPDAFLMDFESRIWITYRSNFPSIPRPDSCDGAPSMTFRVRLKSQFMDSHGFTSDTGWGCMIRSGQSLLANALSILILGRDWRRGNDVEEETELLSLFADHPSAPFSIHRFVQHGADSCGKYPGEWFGPSATARCIQALSNQCEHPKLRVYITNDSSEVYEDRFIQIACEGSEHIKPTLILLGIRLGIDHVTPVYWDGLKAALQYPQSVGIAGYVIPSHINGSMGQFSTYNSGRPSASHYFVGVQGSHYFYLDPHYTRPALSCRQTDKAYTKEELDTYHTRRLRRIHIKDMDPSMLIGFLIRDQYDWMDWKTRVVSVHGKPIVNIVSGIQTDHGYGREEALDEVEALDDFDIPEQ